MNTSEDEPLSGLNARLRPRKSNAPSPQTKVTKKGEGKTASDKAKRTSNPSKVLPNKPDDLATKSDSTPAPQFMCPYCDRQFAAKQTVSKHARRIHLSSSKQDSFIACLFCSYTGAESNDIIRHMIDNHPNQYFACMDCHTRFPSTSELAEHKLNVCEKQKPYRSKLRPKTSPESKSRSKSLTKKTRNEDFRANNELDFNRVVISCELKPSQVHDEADIEHNITTNLILPPSKNLGNNPVIEKNAVIVLDDIHWNKRIPANFSFHNTDADQILSRLGVVHRSPRTGETTRKEWLRSIDDTAQKFEKCFDTSFYSKVASNVQENLSKCLDGSFNFNPDLENTIKTRKAKNSVVINTAEGFPILLAFEQYSRNLFDSYLPRGIAPKHKWKWDSLENDKHLINPDQIKRDSHANKCIISLVSSLDIWTQLCMRRKYELKFNVSHVEKKTEKQNVIDRELKEILESRELPTTSSQVVKFTSKPAVTTNFSDFPFSLGLTPSTPSYDLPPAVLSGEWVRPRCYVCCACGAQSRDSRALSTHISIEHPNAQVEHYEIVGKPLLNADILKHLYVPPSQVTNRTRPLRGFRDCTKCKKSITLDELHQHMLDCAGDTPAVRRKCRYRPFGVRKRRPRLPDNILRRKIRKDLRNRHKQKSAMRPRPKIRSEVGDAETIRKMIADLPAKRHRVMINPMNPALRPRKKHDKQRNKLMMKLRTSEDPKTRRLRAIKEMNINNTVESSCSNKDEQNSTTSNKDDEDNMPLLPKKRIAEKNNRHTETMKRKCVINRAKRKIRIKNKTTKLPETDFVATKSNTEKEDLSSNEQKQEKINLNEGQNNSRQQSERGGNKRRGNERPRDQGMTGGGNDRQHTNLNNNNGSGPNAPAQNTPLKHSIANLTADFRDKSIELHQLFLMQQECNSQKENQYVPSEQKQLFENEEAESSLDKPPISNQSAFKMTKFIKKGGLHDCITKLINKLHPDDFTSSLSGQSMSLDNNESIECINVNIDPNNAEIVSRSVVTHDTTGNYTSSESNNQEQKSSSNQKSLDSTMKEIDNKLLKKTDQSNEDTTKPDSETETKNDSNKSIELSYELEAKRQQEKLLETTINPGYNEILMKPKQIYIPIPKKRPRKKIKEPPEEQFEYKIVEPSFNVASIDGTSEQQKAVGIDKHSNANQQEICIETFNKEDRRVGTNFHPAHNEVDNVPQETSVDPGWILQTAKNKKQDQNNDSVRMAARKPCAKVIDAVSDTADCLLPIVSSIPKIDSNQEDKSMKSKTKDNIFLVPESIQSKQKELPAQRKSARLTRSNSHQTMFGLPAQIEVIPQTCLMQINTSSSLPCPDQYPIITVNADSEKHKKPSHTHNIQPDLTQTIQIERAEDSKEDSPVNIYNRHKLDMSGGRLIEQNSFPLVEHKTLINQRPLLGPRSFTEHRPKTDPKLFAKQLILAEKGVLNDKKKVTNQLLSTPELCAFPKHLAFSELLGHSQIADQNSFLQQSGFPTPGIVPYMSTRTFPNPLSFAALRSLPDQMKLADQRPYPDQNTLNQIAFAEQRMFVEPRTFGNPMYQDQSMERSFLEQINYTTLKTLSETPLRGKEAQEQTTASENKQKCKNMPNKEQKSLPKRNSSIELRQQTEVRSTSETRAKNPRTYYEQRLPYDRFELKSQELNQPKSQQEEHRLSLFDPERLLHNQRSALEQVKPYELQTLQEKQKQTQERRKSHEQRQLSVQTFTQDLKVPQEQRTVIEQKSPCLEQPSPREQMSHGHEQWASHEFRTQQELRAQQEMMVQQELRAQHERRTQQLLIAQHGLMAQHELRAQQDLRAQQQLMAQHELRVLQGARILHEQMALYEKQTLKEQTSPREPGIPRENKSSCDQKDQPDQRSFEYPLLEPPSHDQKNKHDGTVFYEQFHLLDDKSFSEPKSRHLTNMPLDHIQTTTEQITPHEKSPNDHIVRNELRTSQDCRPIRERNLASETSAAEEIRATEEISFQHKNYHDQSQQEKDQDQRNTHNQKLQHVKEIEGRRDSFDSRSSYNEWNKEIEGRRDSFDSRSSYNEWNQHERYPYENKPLKDKINLPDNKKQEIIPPKEIIPTSQVTTVSDHLVTDSSNSIDKQKLLEVQLIDNGQKEHVSPNRPRLSGEQMFEQQSLERRLSEHSVSNERKSPLERESQGHIVHRIQEDSALTEHPLNQEHKLLPESHMGRENPQPQQPTYVEKSMLKPNVEKHTDKNLVRNISDNKHMERDYRDRSTVIPSVHAGLNIIGDHDPAKTLASELDCTPLDLSVLHGSETRVLTPKKKTSPVVLNKKTVAGAMDLRVKTAQSACNKISDFNKSTDKNKIDGNALNYVPRHLSFNRLRRESIKDHEQYVHNYMNQNVNLTINHDESRRIDSVSTPTEYSERIVSDMNLDIENLPVPEVKNICVSIDLTDDNANTAITKIENERLNTNYLDLKPNILHSSLALYTSENLTSTLSHETTIKLSPIHENEDEVFQETTPGLTALEMRQQSSVVSADAVYSKQETTSATESDNLDKATNQPSIRNLHAHTLSNIMMSTPTNKLTKIRTSDSNTLPNNQLSIAGPSISKATSIYTLTGPSVEQPGNYSMHSVAQITQGDSGIVAQSIVNGLENSFDDENRIETEISVPTNNLDQDPETARKIALLPKELVEILGTMPADHRKQLLNVLPQYVSTSTAGTHNTNRYDIEDSSERVNLHESGSVYGYSEHQVNAYMSDYCLSQNASQCQPHYIDNRPFLLAPPPPPPPLPPSSLLAPPPPPTAKHHQHPRLSFVSPPPPPSALQPTRMTLQPPPPPPLPTQQQNTSTYQQEQNSQHMLAIQQSRRTHHQASLLPPPPPPILPPSKLSLLQQTHSQPNQKSDQSPPYLQSQLPHEMLTPSHRSQQSDQLPAPTHPPLPKTSPPPLSPGQDIKPIIITKKENAEEELIIVDETYLQTGSTSKEKGITKNNTENKVIDLTTDDEKFDESNKKVGKNVNVDIPKLVFVPVSDLTNPTSNIKTKSRAFNDKTASLRAVRIKTPSERNKSVSIESQASSKIETQALSESGDHTLNESEKQANISNEAKKDSKKDTHLVKTSNEKESLKPFTLSTLPETQIVAKIISENIRPLIKSPSIDTKIQTNTKSNTENSVGTVTIDDIKAIELCKVLAIQQAEVSSTQHNNKQNTVSTAISPITLEASTSANSEVKNITTIKDVISDKDVIHDESPTPKPGTVTSSIIKEGSKESKTKDPIERIDGIKQQNIVNYEGISQHLSPVKDNNLKEIHSEWDNTTIKSAHKHNIVDEVGLGTVTALQVKQQIETTEEDSEDDLSLAVIVKKREQLQNISDSNKASENVLPHNTQNAKKKSRKTEKKETVKHLVINECENKPPNDLSNNIAMEKSPGESNIPDVLNSAHMNSDENFGTNASKKGKKKKKGYKKIALDEALVRNQTEGDIQIKAMCTDQENITVKESDRISTTSKSANKPEILTDSKKEKEVSSVQSLAEQFRLSHEKQQIFVDVTPEEKNDRSSPITEKTLILTENRLGNLDGALKVTNLENNISTNNKIFNRDEMGVKNISEKNDLITNEDKKPKKIVRVKKGKDSVESCEVLETDIMDTKIENDDDLTPLRRSRRGKSMFVENSGMDQERILTPEPPSETKVPLTKKQLIFSKLLLDGENHTTSRQVQSEPEKDPKDQFDILVDSRKSISEENETNVGNQEIENTESNTVKKMKRKKSPLIKLKKKKKKSEVSGVTKEQDKTSNDETSESILSTNSLINTDLHAPYQKKENKESEDAKIDVLKKEATHIKDPESLIKDESKNNINFDADKISTDEKIDKNEKLMTSAEKRKTIAIDTKAKKTKLITKLDKNTKVECDKLSDKNDVIIKTNKISLPIETKTTCYMPVAAKRTRSKSVIVKSSSADLYDPYDIDLDDMIEKNVNLGRKRNVSDRNTQNQKYLKNSCITKSSKTRSILIKNSNKAARSKEIFSDSDDSSKSDVPLKKLVEDKEKKVMQSENLIFNRKTNNSKNASKIKFIQKSNSKEPKKGRKTLAPFNSVDKSGASKESAEQLRSEQFMESFGFFSERKPRKSNLLASKKISETFHIIERDDKYYCRQRSSKRETRKFLDSRSSRVRRAPKRSIKRGRINKKKTFIKPLPCFCGICKKEFRRPDNYLRHQMTLLHISKLSEMEVKGKTNPVHEEPNYLIVYKQQLDRLKILSKKFARNKKKNPKSKAKFKLPTLDEILVEVNKTVRDQQLAERGLSNDEALFLDCCQLLKSNKNDVPPVKTVSLNTANKFSCANETTVKEFDLLEKPTKGDGDVDSITAKNILESEEVRNLEKDLISGLKEAANASTLKSKVPYQRSISDVELNQSQDDAYSGPNTSTVPNYGAAPACSNKVKKHPEVKEKMYPDIIDPIDMFEDKFDKIKRKCRSQAAAAKQTQPVVEPKPSQKGRKKTEKKKGKKNSRKNTHQVLTKGALKGFDGIKVSIPTTDINMSAIVPPVESTPKKKKKSNSKKKKDKRVSESKYESQARTKDTSNTQKKVDVYEFMDNEDAELFEFRPSTLMERFKSINNKDSASTSKCNPVIDEADSSESISDGDDFVYMSDDYVCSDDETENSLVSGELTKVGTDIKKNISPLKRKDAVEKNAVMGKIFKNNAVRSDRKSTKAKEPAKPKANLDQLFDSLLEDEPNSSMLNSDISSPTKDNCITPKKHEQSSKKGKNSHTYSDDDDISYYSKCRDSSPHYADSPSSRFYVSPSRRYSNSPPRRYYNSPPRRYYNSPSRRYYNSPPRRYYNSPPRRYYNTPPRRYANSPYRGHRDSPTKSYYCAPPDLYSGPPNRYSDSPPRRNYYPTYHYSDSTPKRSESPPKNDYSPASPDPEPSTSKKYDERASDIESEASPTKKLDNAVTKRESPPKKFQSTCPKKQETTTKDYSVPTKHTETTPKKDDEDLNISCDSKSKSSKEKSPALKLNDVLTNQYSNNVYDDLAYDDLGVARQRARRKCTVGKQNVLAETWSSESEPDGLPPRPNSAESVVMSSARKKKGKKKDGHQVSARRGNNKHVTFKKQDVESRVTNRIRRASSAGGSRGEGESDEEASCVIDPYAAPVASTSQASLAPLTPRIRPRPASYYWSSEGDEEQEHLQQHGWIVGDSHKKLVTMLAHAKGRKRNDDKRNLIE